MVWLDAPTEITDFDYISIFDKDVFRFDVTMNQSLFMQIINTWANLYEKVKSSILTQKLFFPNQIK